MIVLDTVFVKMEHSLKMENVNRANSMVIKLLVIIKEAVLVSQVFIFVSDIANIAKII